MEEITVNVIRRFLIRFEFGNVWRRRKKRETFQALPTQLTSSPARSERNHNRAVTRS